MKCSQWVMLAGGMIFLTTSQAYANKDELKLYKEAFPGESPKCISCHKDKLPKKDDGKHDLNAYGESVLKENPKPDVETYKKIGRIQLDEQAAADAQADSKEAEGEPESPAEEAK